MEDIIKNAEEFLDSAEDNLKKERWNAAVSDFFKSIATFCDYLLYKEIRILPKNHNERFNLLQTHFKDIYNRVLDLFKKYRESYNLRLKKEDAITLKEYAHKLKEFVRNNK